MEYYYLDLKKKLSTVLHKYPNRQLQQITELRLFLNIDGIPLFRSASSLLWPILCVVNVIPLTDDKLETFLITLCYGKTKPTDLNFMSHTIADSKVLISKVISISVSSVIYDAPAKALIKGTKLL